MTKLTRTNVAVDGVASTTITTSGVAVDYSGMNDSRAVMRIVGSGAGTVTILGGDDAIYGGRDLEIKFSGAGTKYIAINSVNFKIHDALSADKGKIKVKASTTGFTVEVISLP